MRKPKNLLYKFATILHILNQYNLLEWDDLNKQVMDKQPLIVDESMPVEQVSQLATSRSIHNYYDLVIITRDGRMSGAATIRSILETITNIRMETARVDNPLTGLPGNLQINRELSKRLIACMKFSVIYIDLDFFKWFNDRFGFQKGSRGLNQPSARAISFITTKKFTIL